MVRKSFLSRIDRSTVNGTVTSGHSNKTIYASINKFLRVFFLTIMHEMGIKPRGMKGGSMRRHSGHKRRKRSLF